MGKQVQLLGAVLFVSGVLSIVYSVLAPEKAKKLNTWYYILGNKRNDYDFTATIKRMKLVYYYFTGISTVGILFAFFNQRIGELFVWVIFASLLVALYYLQPVKIQSTKND